MLFWRESLQHLLLSVTIDVSSGVPEYYCLSIFLTFFCFPHFINNCYNYDIIIHLIITFFSNLDEILALTILQVVPVCAREELVTSESFITHPIFTVSTQIENHIFGIFADRNILRKLQRTLQQQ